MLDYKKNGLKDLVKIYIDHASDMSEASVKKAGYNVSHCAGANGLNIEYSIELKGFIVVDGIRLNVDFTAHKP